MRNQRSQKQRKKYGSKVGEERKGEMTREKMTNGTRQEKNEIKQGKSRNEEKKREEMEKKKEYKKGYNNIQFFVMINS